MIRLTDNRFGANAALLEPQADSCLCYECRENRKQGDPYQTVHKKAEIVRSLLQGCADKPLRELSNDNLIVFAKEKDLDQHFINIRIQTDTGDAVRIETGNMMGVLCVREKGSSLKVQIKSRFDTGAKQYFLNYLLSKVFDVNFAGLVSSNDDVMWDLLLAFVFVWKFRKTAEAGLYKQYHTNQYNDLNFRGKLDLDRHLQRNYPLCDRLAYSKREITFNNPLNHLLRFAVAKIERKWPSMLESGSEVRSLVTALKQATPSWNSCGVSKILNHKDCRFPVRQPFFSEYYEPLRKIARMLLLDEGANIFDDASSESETEISGIVFDGSWLWEAYLAKVLSSAPLSFRHHDTDIPDDGFPIFENGCDKSDVEIFHMFPDFSYLEKNIVLDAKYKRGKSEREDLYQVMAYMLRTGATHGGLIYPPEECVLTHDCKTFANVEPKCYWKSFAFAALPENVPDAGDYIARMREREEKIRNDIKKFIEQGLSE